MKPALDAKDCERLCRLLGMVGSAHDGEALNAARKAHQLIHLRGLVWSDVICAPSLVPPAEPAPAYDGVPSWREQLDACLEAIDELGERDANFIEALADWRGTLSPKQKRWLRDIYSRISPL